MNADLQAILLLRAALTQSAESLALARDRLGFCGEGDGKDRRADNVDSTGSLDALKAAFTALDLTKPYDKS